MIIWIDAHLSPSIAAWINRNHTSVQAKSLSSMNLQRADDRAIVEEARKADAVIMSKDSDFLRLVEQVRYPASNHLDHLRKHIEYQNERSARKNP